MAAHTMSASAFVNTMQIDYEAFRRETLEAIAYVRRQTRQAKAPSSPSRAHA